MKVKVTGPTRTFVLERVDKDLLKLTVYEKARFFRKKVYSQTYLKQLFNSQKLARFIEDWA